MSSFLGFGTAVSGLRANQKALEVTGHNVANLGTIGFSRQSAIMEAAATRAYDNWRVEMGVDIQQIRQIRHSFNDNIYRSESNKLGYWESRNKAISDIESILGEPINQGFQASLNNFWDSFQELSKAPESLTIRALVKQRTDSLANYLNRVGSQINKLQKDINTEIKSRIDEVNDITEGIAALNVKIMSAEATGNTPNDYYDQRNTLCDKLAKLVDAETWETIDGSVDILVGGYFLVSRGDQTKLVAEPDKNYSHFYEPKIQTRGGNIAIDVGTGIIKGLLEARGEVSGAKGSYENGSPNTTADITIAVDISNPLSMPASDYLDNIKDQVNAFIKDVQTRGLDYNFRLLTFGGSESTNINFFKDVDALNTALDAIVLDGDATNNFKDVVDQMLDNNYVEYMNKYLMVFTDKSINGEGTPTDSTDISEYINSLTNEDITMSVSTNTPSEAGEASWEYIAGRTGGKLYDTSSLPVLADPDDSEEPYYLAINNLMQQASSDINIDVNTKMSTIPENLNIISSVKKQLNALINIMAREVNRFHMMGKTLKGEDGGIFFEPIESTFPIELGNIKISDNLKDLNNIAAATTDANGDNRIALEIAGLRNANVMTGNKKVLSLDTYYQNIIMDIGNKGYEAANMTESYQSLVSQADAMRQSVMGVSLDEEMSNMIKFKFAYNANAKVIDVVNQMLETILFRMGAA